MLVCTKINSFGIKIMYVSYHIKKKLWCCILKKLRTFFSCLFGTCLSFSSQCIIVHLDLVQFVLFSCDSNFEITVVYCCVITAFLIMLSTQLICCIGIKSNYEPNEPCQLIYCYAYCKSTATWPLYNYCYLFYLCIVIIFSYVLFKMLFFILSMIFLGTTLSRENFIFICILMSIYHRGFIYIGRNVQTNFHHYFVYFCFFVDKRHLTMLKKYLMSCKIIHKIYSFVIQFVKRKNLKIGFLNPGSLGTRHEEFLVALENRSVDIMALNETWLRRGEESRAPLPAGYRLRHIPRPPSVRARGGGVGFYVRNGIYARQIKPPQVSSVVEQMWLSITVNGTRFAIGTAYRPPWLSVDTFLDALTETVSSFSIYDHIILVGDFNINLLANDPNTKKLTSFLQYSNLDQYVTLPTHFTGHSETLIDLLCSSMKILNVCVDYIPDLGNHAFITGDMRVNKPKSPPKWILYRPLKDIVLNEFNAHVNAIPWERLLDESVDVSILSFNAYILHVFDSHAPFTRSLIKHQSYPWITPTIKEMMKLRDEAHTKSRTTKLEAHAKYYKELKVIVSRALHAEKTAYFQQTVNNNLMNSKEMWKAIKTNVVDFNKKQTSLPSNINDPALVNRHFLDVPGHNNVPISDLTYFEYHRFCPASFALSTVDEVTILKIITNITSNAQGVDGITRDMILLTLPRTLGVITAIVNRSIQSETFPKIWKEALVKPIPKTSHPNDLNDLRPISILPFMSKIIEKVVCQQLTLFLNTNFILPQKQSGFRSGHSTATALLDVLDDILAEEDKGRGTVLCLLDFSRAFDAINHSLLLSKLAFYGFNPNTIRWFSSYLSGRLQRVEICGDAGIKSVSVALPVHRGVPQGSILGPILFILYSADLTKCIKNCKYHIYADDLQVYLSCRPDETLMTADKINEDLERISNWAHRNCLVLNPSKSKFLVLGSAAQVSKISASHPMIEIGNAAIRQVSEARNLGVLIDGSMRFHDHVVETVKNCFYRLKVMYRVREYLDVNTRVRLCEALILSKLNYADTVIGECLFGYTKKLIQRVQNACARFTFTIPRRAHVTPFLNRGNLANMQSRRTLHFATLLFGVVQTGSPSYLFDKLVFSNRQPRSGSRLKCPRHGTAAFRGSFRYSATKCWNNIPPPLRLCRTVGSFKINYKRYLMNVQRCT